MRKKEPLVSIIVPTHNRSKMLKKALRSIIKQTYKNIEILIIDDGSIDNTKKVIAKYKDKRVKYFYKINGGISDARNYGLKTAKGKYIAFLDDDDLYLPEKIRSQVEFMQKNKHLGFCYSNLIIQYKGQKSILISKRRENTFISLLLDGTGSYVTTQTILIRRSVIKRVGEFKKCLKQAEDYDYWLRCAKEFKFGYIDKPLAIYRLHNSNVTKNPKKILKWMSVVRLIHLKEVEKSKVPKRYLKKYKWELNYHQGRILYYKKEYKNALPYFFSAIKTNWKKLTAYIYLLQSIIGGDLIVKTSYKMYMYLKFR